MKCLAVRTAAAAAAAVLLLLEDAVSTLDHAAVAATAGHIVANVVMLLV